MVAAVERWDHHHCHIALRAALLHNCYGDVGKEGGSGSGSGRGSVNSNGAVGGCVGGHVGGDVDADGGSSGEAAGNDSATAPARTMYIAKTSPI